MTGISEHIVQTKQWGKFKTLYGTKSVRVGDVQYTLHKIPFTQYFYAYCPKVNPFKINFSEVTKSLSENNAVCINFDVPNVLKNSGEFDRAVSFFEENQCVKSPRDTFAKFNVLMDLTKSEDELLMSMHKKHRYNIAYAQKNGLVSSVVSYDNSQNAKDSFESFYNLHKSTADRQKYYTHSKRYLETVWKIMGEAGIAKILNVSYQEKALSSWMLFVHDGVLYYPYGGSSEQHKKLYASNLAGWEAIKFGKASGCHTFDMWGAGENPNDTTDPWWGFTNFKMKFGGAHVEYMDSYDFVVNKVMYNAFILANDLRWKLLKLLKS